LSRGINASEIRMLLVELSAAVLEFLLTLSVFEKFRRDDQGDVEAEEIELFEGEGNGEEGLEGYNVKELQRIELDAEIGDEFG
jgi:hypothetical protein